MNVLKVFLFISLFVLLASCGEKQTTTQVTFESAFPGANKDLTRVLGHSFSIRSGSDTFNLAISVNGSVNLIKDAHSGDTLFLGKVRKYKGLYYFNQVLPDSTFEIYAVKISGDQIFGLGTGFQQAYLLRQEISRGNYPHLIKFISPDTSLIRLYTKKRELRKLFSPVVNTLSPDIILTSINQDEIESETVVTLPEVDPVEVGLISEVYPNPVSDFVTINLHKPGRVNYHLTDLKGKLILTGQFNQPEKKLNIENLRNGYYNLTVINPENKQKETVKLLKNTGGSSI